MTSLSGVAGVFERAADTYDDVGVARILPIAAGLVDELVAQPGERVLDIGCGRGAALERTMWEAVPESERASSRQQIMGAAQEVVSVTQEVRYTAGRLVINV